MKIVFAGSPAFAVPVLERLAASGVEILAVVTQPDRPVGRKRIPTGTPVKMRATELGLKVLDYEKIREHAGELKELGADIMITCAYGQILSEEVLAAFERGVWNLHASLLPKFRGASPVQAAILAGEEFTGITVMKTEPALDSGDILLVKRIKIGEETCGELEKKLAVLAADAAEEAINYLEAGNVQLLMQDAARASYCKKINKQDCRIDFKRPAGEVLRAIKAFSPQPAAYCMLNGAVLNILDAEIAEESGRTAGRENGASLNMPAAEIAEESGRTAGRGDGAECGEVLEADRRGIRVACGENSIRITILQPAGGKVMTAREFLNGRKIKVGDILD